MAYRISVSTRAQRDYADLFASIHVEDSPTAARWHRKLRQAILSLEDMPDRCPCTIENKKLRHLLYGSKPNVNRVIFRIVEREKTVEILHIRHGARDQFTKRQIS